MLVVAVASLAVAGACGADETDYQEAAVEVIEGDLADELGVELTGECDDPADDEEGTTFACTADLPDGQVAEFTATVGDGEVDVQSTNLLTADDLAGVESEAAEVLAAEVGQALPAEAIDCGEEVAVVADAEVAVVADAEPIVCALTSPDSGEVFDATITFSDVAAGDFDIVVAETPR